MTAPGVAKMVVWLPLDSPEVEEVSAVVVQEGIAEAATGSVKIVALQGAQVEAVAMGA